MFLIIFIFLAIISNKYDVFLLFQETDYLIYCVMYAVTVVLGNTTASTVATVMIIN